MRIDMKIMTSLDFRVNLWGIILTRFSQKWFFFHLNVKLQSSHFWENMLNIWQLKIKLSYKTWKIIFEVGYWNKEFIEFYQNHYENQQQSSCYSFDVIADVIVRKKTQPGLFSSLFLTRTIISVRVKNFS